MIFEFKTAKHIEHRTNGFRCTGNFSVIVRENADRAPVVDIICQKCHELIELGIEVVEVTLATAPGYQERINATELHDGKFPDPTARLAGKDAPEPFALNGEAALDLDKALAGYTIGAGPAGHTGPVGPVGEPGTSGEPGIGGPSEPSVERLDVGIANNADLVADKDFGAALATE